MLLGIGIAGFIGTSFISRFRKDGPYRTLIVIPVAMAGIAVTLILFGGHLAVTATVLAAWGLVGTVTQVGWWTWLTRSLPDDAKTGGDLLVAVIQLAITFGAVIGGVLYNMSGYRITFAARAGLLLIAALSAILTSRQRQTA